MRVLLAAWVALGALACGRDGEEPAPEGGTPWTAIRPAPEFTLETLDGDTVSLASLDGQEAILMNFWASWCLPCKAETPEFIELHQAYGTQGLAVLGVTVNDLPNDSRAFVEELGVPYPSVIGTPAMLEDYGLSPWLPITLLVVDRQIVREWFGPRTREELEYPIKVALGLAPPVEEILEEPDDGGR